MRVRDQVPLAPLTTLGVGGSANVLVDLEDLAEFPDLVELARAWDSRPLVLGGGSNILVADSGCPAPVIRMAARGIRMRRADDTTIHVSVQAGHPLSELVSTTIEHGLAGMETLAGIPGTVGATPIQNVGAYGREVGDTLVSVEAWDWQTSQMLTLTAAECRLGHRTSLFKHTARFTLLTATFALRQDPLSIPITYRGVAEVLDVPIGTRVPLADAAAAVLTVRKAKGMVLGFAGADDRSAGSVFLSPVIDQGTATELRAQNAPVHDFPDGSTRVSASWLIQQAGFALGQPVAAGVRLSARHYTLVAEPGATAAGFAHAVEIVAHKALAATGVRLTPEPDLFGREPTYQRLIDDRPSV